jgi:hypothetical protein
MTAASASIVGPSNAGVERGIAIYLGKSVSGPNDHAELREMIDHVLVTPRIVFGVDDDAAGPVWSCRSGGGPPRDIWPLRGPPCTGAFREVRLLGAGHSR